MRIFRLALIALMIGGCTASTDNVRPPVALELYAKPIGPAQNCVPVSIGEDLTVIRDGTLGVRSGKTLWINDTGDACRSIRMMNTLIVERHGSQLCRGDHVRSVEFSGGIPGPVCILGNFVPYREN